MALQDPNMMPSSRLDCPLSLETPNMGNTGQDSASQHDAAGNATKANSPPATPAMGIDNSEAGLAKYPRTTLIRPLDGLAKRGRVGRPRTASFTLASTRASIVSWTRDRNDSITSSSWSIPSSCRAFTATRSSSSTSADALSCCRICTFPLARSDAIRHGVIALA